MKTKPKKKTQTLRAYLYSIASLLLIALIVVFPILYTFYISLTNMNTYHWFEFDIIGFKNYVDALFVIDSGFLVALLRTILWTVVNMVTQLIIAYVIAVLLNSKKLRLKNVYKTILMFPWAMPGYVSILLWKTGMFNTQFGLLNKFMQKMGLGMQSWLATNTSAFLCCSVVIAQQIYDGFLIHAGSFDKKLQTEICKKGIPHILIGKPDVENKSISWIDNDNEISGAIAVKHLIDLNRKKIAFIGGEKYDTISEARYRGVCNYLESVHMELPQSLHLRGESTRVDGAYMASKLLKRDEKVDGIVCANTAIALGVLSYLKNKVRVPEDIAVVSFDKYPYSQITTPQITVVDLDMFDLGIKASKLLLDKISKPDLNFGSYATLPTLIIRGSTVKQDK